MDPSSPLFHAKHVLRAGFLFILGVVALIVLRSWLAPPTWGEYGAYRGASVDDYRALPPIHGAAASCAECHEDRYAEHEKGVHAQVECELCHAPLATHVVDGEVVAEMPVPASSDLCLNCHRKLTARPSSFPQILPAEHLKEMEAEPGPRVCFDCHDPHSPF